MIRSSRGMKFDMALRNVVFPEPVPPLIKILYLALTSFPRKSAASGVMEPYFKSWSTVIGVLENFRMVTMGPDRESGGRTTFTREPSASRVSTIGLASLTSFPTDPTIF